MYISWHQHNLLCLFALYFYWLFFSSVQSTVQKNIIPLISDIPRTCCTGWDSNLNWPLYFNEMPVVHLYEQLLGLNVGLCYSVSDGQPHLRWQEINYLSTFKIFPFFTSLCLLQRPLPKKGCCCGVKGKLLLTEMWTFRTSILGNLPLFQEIEAISKMLCQISPTVVQVYIWSENFALP